MQKVKPIKSQKMRDSARGEECTMQIPGVCSRDSATVVLCHFPDDSHGMGKKADDISAGYCCNRCHDVADGRVHDSDWAAWGDWYMRRSQTRTLRRMIEKGVIKI